MKNAKFLDSKTCGILKDSLKERLHELKKNLSEHEKETIKALPSNSSEAASLKGDLEIIEAEERFESSEIRLIESALERLTKGTYGRCISCDAPIGKERLLAVPETAFCRVCKKNYEPGKFDEQSWPY